MENSSSDWQLQLETFSQRAQHLLNNEEWTDCSFLVGTTEKKKIRAHKIILAMSSPVFARMFYGPMAESKFPIPVEDINHDDFESLLRYIYTGNVQLDCLDETMSISYAAKKYMVPGLVKLCIDKCWNYLSPKTACQIYEFSKFFDEEELAKQCLEIISLDTREVLGDPSFLKVNKSTLTTILEMDELSVPSEMELINALYEWAKNECQQRGDASQLRTIVKEELWKLRFLTLTPQEMVERIANTGLLSDLENYAILSNIISPNSTNISMPSYFSTCRTKRKYRNKCLTNDKYSWIQNIKTTHVIKGNISITTILFEVRKMVKLVGVQVSKRSLQYDNLWSNSVKETKAVIRTEIAFLGGKPISNSSFKEMEIWEMTTMDINFDQSVLLERNNVYVLTTELHHPQLAQFLIYPQSQKSQWSIYSSGGFSNFPSVSTISQGQYPQFSLNVSDNISFQRDADALFILGDLAAAPSSTSIRGGNTKQIPPSISEQPHFVFLDPDNIILKIYV